MLIVGLKTLDKPPVTHSSGADYWFDNGKLRETRWNWDWFSSPKAAWEQTPYRDWLIAGLLVNMVGQRQEFLAISEPVLVTFDLLASEIKPEMRTASERIKKIVESDSGYQRAFLTTLTFGLSRQVSNGKDVVVFGAGLRRYTRVWLKGVSESEALHADIEFFVPFYVATGGDGVTGDKFPDARSICAGIALKRVNGSSIGLDSTGKDLAGLRFNFRIPYKARMVGYRERFDSDIETIFGEPKVEAQKRGISPMDKEGDLAWEKCDDWKDIVERLAGSVDGKELLDAPIGPLLLEEISESSIKDIYKIDAVKRDKEDAKEELKAARDLLKGLWNRKAPDDPDEPDEPEGQPETTTGTKSPSERTLGKFLETLGLLTSKGKIAELSKLTVWDVFSRTLDEMDGFPLYVLGVNPSDDKGVRAALTLASQSDLSNPSKHYFGLAGLAYDIPVKTAPKKDKYRESTQYLFVEEDDDDTADPLDDSPLIVSDDDDSPLIASHDEDSSPLIDDGENAEDGTAGGGGDDPGAPPKDEKAAKSVVEVFLHLGNWFSGETLDDNWFRRLLPPAQALDKSFWQRRTPLPGIRLLPLRKEPSTVGKDPSALFGLTMRGELLSLGFDLRGNTKDGLTFLKKGAGPLAYFGLGSVETRVALLLSKERVAFGMGVKLKDLRLSLAPKTEEQQDEKKSGDDEFTKPLKEILSDSVEVPVSAKEKEKSKAKTVRTRLGGKRKDKFSVSVGYLSPLTEGSYGTLDIQLYDHKGKRGELVLIPIDRRAGVLYLKNIGIGLKGVENLELNKGLSDDAQITIALTGGMRAPLFELGLIGAKLTIPFRKPKEFQFGLDGLDLSLDVSGVIISGSFLKTEDGFAGQVTIDAPKISIGAMGAYSKLQVLNQKFEDDTAATLKRGELPAKLRSALAEKAIHPAPQMAVTTGAAAGNWTLKAADGKKYFLVQGGGKLKVFSDDTTLFIYGALSATSGGGITVGPVQFTGFALGFGLHRRVKVPAVEGIAEFPLVKMVMGEGGFQKEEIGGGLQEQLAKPVEDPMKVLEQMEEDLPVERGQYFICAGVRFTIAQTTDCFGLIIVQFGNEFEFSLLGLARMRQPRDLKMKPLCYIELQILLSVKPSEGCFKLQAVLSNNSWVINQNCRLTGGFALYVWFGGKHKGDFVITLGGYHPRFRRPDHYPIVPRLGLNWQISESLRIKGELYLAVTSSCFMLGGKLEAAFYASRVSVWFTAYFDALISWSPLHYEMDIGIALRAEVDLFLFTLRLTVSALVQLWGPPDGGLIRLELSVLTLDVPFGTPREQASPQLIKSWAEFCGSFLPAAKPSTQPGAAQTVSAGVVQPNLASGRANAAGLERNVDGGSASARQAGTAESAERNKTWRVRGDELVLAAAASVPVTALNFGRVKTSSPPQGVQDVSLTGRSLLVSEPVMLEPSELQTRRYPAPLGVHPVGKKLESVLNVTIVRDDVSPPQPVDTTGWTLEEETDSLPAALWDAAKPNPKGPAEPEARLIQNCITGIKRLVPPAGEYGAAISPPAMSWTRLSPVRVSRPSELQENPAKTRARNIQKAIDSKQAEQKRVFDALAAAGFRLAWQPAQTPVRCRDLQAEPLAGAVATFVQ